MSKASDKIEKFLTALIRTPGVPAFIRTHVASEMKKVGTKEAAVNAQIAIVKNSANTPAQRKAALTLLLNAFREGI